MRLTSFDHSSARWQDLGISISFSNPFARHSASSLGIRKMQTNRLVLLDQTKLILLRDLATRSFMPAAFRVLGCQGFASQVDHSRKGETAPSRVDRRWTLPVLPISSPDSLRRMHELIDKLTPCRSARRTKHSMPSSGRSRVPHSSGLRCSLFGHPAISSSSGESRQQNATTPKGS